MNKLNLGCGNKILKGYLNVDVADLSGVNIIHDLNKTPYPFKENSIEEVFCRHFLEHVDNLFFVLEEICRISKNHSKVKIIAPYFSGQGAFNDPQHKRFFTYKTFDYFSQKGYYSKAKFVILKRKIFFFSASSFMKSKIFSIPFDFLISICPVFYQRFLCWIFPSSEIHFLLEVIK
ncbi:MAG: methyltransferase domain-containing protein [Nanoarchaeota archaeon]|nr:methyltransferase domain-containing protein [Nanoarchaeota archaeon]MBU1855346.1 methyltransferase domain-containing protein [Nanoarchaeota archaeon]